MSERIEQPIMSKADYARARGISGSHVSRLAKSGRVILDERGRVIVAASDALREKLRDPTRGGVGGSPAAAAELGAHQAGAMHPHNKALELMTLAEVTKSEKVERIRLLQLEVAQQSGRLVRRDVVDAQIFQLSRQAQELLMALRERLVPLLAFETDERAIDTLLDTEFRQVLALISLPPAEQAREAA